MRCLLSHRRLGIAAMLVVLAIFPAPPLVLAHAHFDHATPGPSDAVSASPTAVTIWFTDEIQGSQNWIHVLTDDGGRVDLNDSTIVGDDHRGLTVHLRPGLPQGFYTVSWQNVATDGDGLTGSYRFGVGIIHPLNVEPLESGDTD